MDRVPLDRDLHDPHDPEDATDMVRRTFGVRDLVRLCLEHESDRIDALSARVRSSKRLGHHRLEEIIQTMELGNICFGNSRGDHSVDRDLQTYFCRQLEELGFDHYGVANDLPRGDRGQFENEVFWIMPYCWSDCDCEYEDKENSWSEANKHDSSCYQIALSKFEDDFRDKHGSQYLNEKNSKLYEKEINTLLAQFKLPKYPSGSAIHCTCDYDVKWKEWSSKNDHAETCCLVLPNFWHKPTGLKIKWYKYALRDSYSNQSVDMNLLKKVFKSCKASLGKQFAVQKKKA
jgi:hypothetical protein